VDGEAAFVHGGLALKLAKAGSSGSLANRQDAGKVPFHVREKKTLAGREKIF